MRKNIREFKYKLFLFYFPHMSKMFTKLFKTWKILKHLVHQYIKQRLYPEVNINKYKHNKIRYSEKELFIHKIKQLSIKNQATSMNQAQGQAQHRS